MTPRTPFAPFSAPRRWSMGRAKAAVLPVPVAAWPEHVAAGEQGRDRLTLDRGRLLVSEGLERVHQPGVEAEIGERLRRRPPPRASSWLIVI